MFLSHCDHIDINCPPHPSWIQVYSIIKLSSQSTTAIIRGWRFECCCYQLCAILGPCAVNYMLATWNGLLNRMAGVASVLLALGACYQIHTLYNHKFPLLSRRLIKKTRIPFSSFVWRLQTVWYDPLGGLLSLQFQYIYIWTVLILKRGLISNVLDNYLVFSPHLHVRPCASFILPMGWITETYNAIC